MARRSGRRPFGFVCSTSPSTSVLERGRVVDQIMTSSSISLDEALSLSPTWARPRNPKGRSSPPMLRLCHRQTIALDFQDQREGDIDMHSRIPTLLDIGAVKGPISTSPDTS